MTMWIKAIKQAAILVLAAAVLAGISYLVRPSARQFTPADSAAVDGMDSSGEISVIGLDQARLHFEQGTALFADARSLADYQSGHIQGAMHLDPNEFDAWSGDFFSRISPDQIIIAYCEGPRCTLSLELAEKLIWMGYEKVFYLKNGWGLWKDKQLPTE